MYVQTYVYTYMCIVVSMCFWHAGVVYRAITSIPLSKLCFGFFLISSVGAHAPVWPECITSSLVCTCESYWCVAPPL